jgi:hypothetical protein
MQAQTNTGCNDKGRKAFVARVSVVVKSVQGWQSDQKGRRADTPPLGQKLTEQL